MPTLGSGCGDRIAIRQTSDQLDVERVVFVPREIQPLVRYRYALDGSVTENAVSMGRTGPALRSTAAWDGNRLVITTRHAFQDPENGRQLEQNVTQTLWLQPSTGTPFEPTLVVETMRGGALGGPASVTRTVYNRGYR